MDILKDLPEGVIPSHMLDAVDQQVVAEVQSYATSRRNDVARGAETEELAAVLVDKYGTGLARTMAIAGIDSSVHAETDRLVREIDPEFDAHRKARWAARPAGFAPAAAGDMTTVASTQDATGSATRVALDAIKRGESITYIETKHDVDPSAR